LLAKKGKKGRKRCTPFFRQREEENFRREGEREGKKKCSPVFSTKKKKEEGGEPFPARAKEKDAEKMEEKKEKRRKWSRPLPHQERKGKEKTLTHFPLRKEKIVPKEGGKKGGGRDPLITFLRQREEKRKGEPPVHPTKEENAREEEGMKEKALYHFLKVEMKGEGENILASCSRETL